MRVSVVSFVILAAVALLAGAGALRGWWRDDDPQVLLQAWLSSPFAVLFSPNVWKTLSSSNFTPLVTISFDADLALGRHVQPGEYVLAINGTDVSFNEALYKTLRDTAGHNVELLVGATPDKATARTVRIRPITRAAAASTRIWARAAAHNRVRRTATPSG